LERRFDDAKAERMYGLRLDWPSGNWLMVRTSNTEQIVRVNAEAATREEAQAVCERAAAVISESP
jgi:phosphomannomutase